MESPEREAEYEAPLVDDVELYTSPWVSGTRAAAYFGPISSELFLEDSSVEDRSEAWSKAERELLESLRDKARSLEAIVLCETSGIPEPSLPTGRR